jgi:hypothetical protein
MNDTPNSDHERPIDVFGYRIPVTAIASLSSSQRWTYYILGLMANELGCILRLVSHSLDPHDDNRRYRHIPDMIQTTMLLRIASAKVAEARLALATKDFKDAFESLVLPHMENGAERRKEINKAFEAAPWLGNLRNEISFHYPEPAKWEALTTPTDEWEDDHVYFGNDPINHFFDASEVITQAWTIQHSGKYKSHPSTQAESETRYFKFIDDSISLTTLLHNFFVDSAMALIEGHLLRGNQSPEYLGRVPGSSLESIKIPTWVFSASASSSHHAIDDKTTTP